MTAEDKAKNAGKVALVLEGGSFRGQFTAGVLDVLMEAGVEIPAVFGVSAGALNGVNYKSHQIGRANRINLAFCNDSRFMGAASFASTGSIVGYDFISVSYTHLSSSPCPLNPSTPLAAMCALRT